MLLLMLRFQGGKALAMSEVKPGPWISRALATASMARGERSEKPPLPTRTLEGNALLAKIPLSGAHGAPTAQRAAGKGGGPAC